VLTEQAEGLLELGHCRGEDSSNGSVRWASKSSAGSSPPQLTLLVAQLLRHGAGCVKQAGWVREWRCRRRRWEFIRAGGAPPDGRSALAAQVPPAVSLLNAPEQLRDLQQECAGAR
jgi:hypothetical protein